ncbi:MAG: tetratricopeptide repeat protein, partial [Acidobacteriota bacterium]
KSLWHQKRGIFLNPNDDRSVCAMGEILTFLGRHEEAEGWVRKAMQLNPYHPSRYWTHLGRTLFHLERFEEAIGAFEHVPRPRQDDLAYRVAASARIGDAPALQRSVAALQEAIPEFDAAAFVASLPYERECDIESVRDALAAAGLST